MVSASTGDINCFCCNANDTAKFNLASTGGESSDINNLMAAIESVEVDKGRKANKKILQIINENVNGDCVTHQSRE